MTVLHSVDFFPSGNASVAIEPRLPQADFPEHHHDFHEIVIVEHGTGIHVFNGQPYTITGGTVCFVRDHDRHLYEHTDNLCLTNVLYRSPDRFQFLAGLNQLLPQELDGQYPSHWRVNHSVLQQVRQLVLRQLIQHIALLLPPVPAPQQPVQPRLRIVAHTGIVARSQIVVAQHQRPLQHWLQHFRSRRFPLWLLLRLYWYWLQMGSLCLAHRLTRASGRNQ